MRLMIQAMLKWNADSAGELEADSLALRDKEPNAWIIRMPHPPRRPRKSFQVLQLWEGVIETIDEGRGEFTALLRDLTVLENPPEEVTLPLMDFPIEHRRKLRAGDRFRWSNRL